VLKHHNDYIKSEAALAPLMYRWVVALLRNQGAETLNGVFVEAQPEVDAAASTAGTTPIAAFEVTLLDQQAARQAFLRALSARRSAFQDVGPAFPRFCRVFWWMLDACMQHEDSRAAQTVLILSETFYEQEPEGHSACGAPAAAALSDSAKAVADYGIVDTSENGAAVAESSFDASPSRPTSGSHNERSESDSADAVRPTPATPAAPLRRYVQSHIRHHPIWRSDFWHESFYRAVRDEVSVKSRVCALFRIGVSRSRGFFSALHR
jgi:hypothetical protein